MMNVRWLYRLTYFYLLLPFALFAWGWLRLMFALPVIALVIWVFFRLDRSPVSEPSAFKLQPSAFVIIFLWVFLSGVGGYAFQNWDHHWRNAVFHDLINYDLPVIYSAPENGPVKMLVYYAGFWLPAVFVGKTFGWGVANFALFLWTLLGVALVVVHISQAVNLSAFKSALLLIFFSGMDALGVLLYPSDYPTLFPPFRHLEIWMNNLQYSSFTTQLFWTFNQAVPGWLCILLVISLSRGQSFADDRPRADVAILAWSMAFFFSPLVSIGLLPYLALELWMQIKRLFKTVRYDVVLTGAVIAILSLLYFSSNSAAQERGLQTIEPSKSLAFFLLEGGILWLLLAPRKRRDPRWALTGVLLFVIPFVKLGNGADFVMRVSIAPLFYLMLITGEALQAETGRFLRAALYALLFVGALTPLYEINRSVYHTAQYYFFMDESQRATPRMEPAVEFERGSVFEYENPDRLVADDIYSFSKLKNKLTQNFVANVRQSLFYRYLSAR